MNDKDFDEIFSDRLNEESAFSGADENWQKLQFRLDLAPPLDMPPTSVPPIGATPVASLGSATPTVGWLQGWAYAAVTTLTLGNVWMWMQVRDVHRQNAELQKSLTSGRIIQRDTIYRIDTIYQKLYLPENQWNEQRNAPSVLGQYSNHSKTLLPIERVQPFSQPLLRNPSSSRAVQTVAHTRKPSLGKWDEGLIQENGEGGAESPATFVDSKLARNVTKPDETKVRQKQDFTFVGLEMRRADSVCSNEPETFALIQPIRAKKKVKNAWQMPEVVLGATGIKGLSDDKFNGYGRGLSAEVALNPQWSFLLTGEAHTTHLEMDRLDRRFRLPPEPTVPINKRLVELEGFIKDMRLGVGFQYNFTPTGRLQPYVNVQHIWKKTQAMEMIFEYEDSAPRPNKERLLQSLPKQSFSKIVQIGMGVRGDVYRNWGWQAGFQYLLDFNKPHQNTNPLAFRAALSYTF